MPALETAPALPVGCVDFNKLHDNCAKGVADPLKGVVIVPENEKLVDEPVPATKPEYAYCHSDAERWLRNSR